MPIDIDCYCMAIRALWVKYDHYSDTATSYIMPKLSEEYESMYTIGTSYKFFVNFIPLDLLVLKLQLTFTLSYKNNIIKLLNQKNLLEENDYKRQN